MHKIKRARATGARGVTFHSQREQNSTSKGYWRPWGPILFPAPAIQFRDLRLSIEFFDDKELISVCDGTHTVVLPRNVPTDTCVSLFTSIRR